MFPLLAIAAQLQIAGPPLATIGTVDGDSLTGLHNVTTVREDRRGNVYVQRGAPYVLVFDGNGQRRAVLGRQGGGPGEFAVPVYVTVIDDTVWVADASLGKLVIFNPDFQHVADKILRRDFPALNERRAIPYGVSRDGIAVESREYGVSGRPNQIVNLLLPREGTEPIEVHRFPETGRITSTMIVDRYTTVAVPLPTHPFVVAAESGVFEFSRDGSSLRVRKVGGEIVTVRGIEGAAVPDAVWDSVVASYAEPLKTGRPSVARRTIEAAIRETLPKPATYTFVRGAQRSRHPDRAWLIHEPPGRRVLYEVDLVTGRVVRTLDATGRDVRALGENHVWVLETDAEDVPFLVKYALRES